MKKLSPELYFWIGIYRNILSVVGLIRKYYALDLFYQELCGPLNELAGLIQKHKIRQEQDGKEKESQG